MREKIVTPDSEEKPVALYHCIYKHEKFEECAKTIHKMVLYARNKLPGKKRLFYLDIEGHRNKAGGFDNDMVELQKEFMLGFMMPYLHETHTPLISVRNPNEQKEDLPEEIQFLPAKEET